MKTEIREHPLVMAAFRWSALLAVACTVIALLLDLQHWAVDGNPWPTSEPWRFARTVLCAVPAFLAMYLRNNRDVRSVFIAMLLAILADLFLVLLHNLIIGISIFAVMQVVLIHRHLRGGAVHAYFRPPLIRAVAIGAVVILVGNGLLWSPLSAKGLSLPVLVYSTLLLTSAVTAFGAGHTEGAGCHSLASGVLGHGAFRALRYHRGHRRSFRPYARRRVGAQPHRSVLHTVTAAFGAFWLTSSSS
jgi:hypothetical protein